MAHLIALDYEIHALFLPTDLVVVLLEVRSRYTVVVAVCDTNLCT